MTKEEAILVLEEEAEYLYQDDRPYSREAFDMAIEALKDNWIPVSEPPKENGNYIVSLEDAVDTSARFFNGKWFMPPVGSIAREYGKHEVLAWQPRPEPYKGGGE